ncbi:RNA polymerase sigma factor [Robertmurraya yapensis]|uniref:RNA polymerase sigma factor n=2 Tax=Bacillaceae TaxID=186817 RepID=A0A3S0JT52_9BACI|nr:RNA polymerase sigma factor [Bacillus yapensis]RTR28419.1 RNA polymerase sigma factor [Bacillus yapensis]TKS94480.1 RNA polymerase sigma factor [Bacillus yapensis]
MEEDLKWISEVLSGDKQAYGNIIKKYKNPLYATIVRMTKNPQDAQDLVQDAFIKVYHQLEKYEQKGSFSSWLYRVAINHCMDQFRKKQYSLELVGVNEDSVVNPNNPEVIFLKKEKQRQLERLIATLPDDERMIILLRYVNELTYEEIGELVGMPITNVRNKLFRAKKKMRDTVIQEGGYFHELSNDR